MAKGMLLFVRNISYAISTYYIIVIDGTVWNIINHAAEEAHQEDDAVAGNDVQQIIYIAYDDNDIENKETSVHIVNQTTMVSNTPRLIVYVAWTKMFIRKFLVCETAHTICRYMCISLYILCENIRIFLSFEFQYNGSFLILHRFEQMNLFYGSFAMQKYNSKISTL